jgi:hypothetical protein
VLRYNQWSSWSRQPDPGYTRTVVTLTLTAEGEAETALAVQHANLTSEETFGLRGSPGGTRSRM